MSNFGIARAQLSGASSGGGAATGTFVENEMPSGTIDDSNLNFTLAHTPTAGTLALYVNRLRLDPNAPLSEFSLSGANITLISPVGAGGSIVADYQYT